MVKFICGGENNEAQGIEETPESKGVEMINVNERLQR